MAAKLLAKTGVMPGYWMKWIRFWRRCQTKLFALRFRFFWLSNSDKFTFLGDSHVEPHFKNRKIKPATWNGMAGYNMQLGIAGCWAGYWMKALPPVFRHSSFVEQFPERPWSPRLWRSQRGATYHDQPCSIGIQPHASRDSSSTHGISCGTQKFNGT